MGRAGRTRGATPDLGAPEACRPVAPGRDSPGGRASRSGRAESPQLSGGAGGATLRTHVNDGRLITPEHLQFSGFIFKIQANMDPKHRDRIAFVRIVSGRFERDMTVFHVQSGRKVRLSSSHKLFGNERETVDEAYPGDIIGLVGHDGFGIGDTLSTDPAIRFDEIPRFTPEVFEYFHNPNTAKFKQFRQGLDQLLLEGVAQAFHLKDTASRVPLLAAVGPLQFEVLQYRLETEYNAETRRESAPFTAVRWLPAGTAPESLDAIALPTGARFAFDLDSNPVILFPSEWSLGYFAQNHPSLPLTSLAPPRRHDR
ncbi:MAG: hypothetical protein FJ396_04835 [Verrucomicrobia bacterium]|nr:hypothetical protein [Verrucomicrobiota bacterium]